MAAKKGGLGRGLDALFADAVPVTNPEPEIKETKAKTSKKKQGLTLAPAPQFPACRCELWNPAYN